MEKEKKTIEGWYDKNYKKLLIIPLLLLVFSIAYMFVFYQRNQDIMYKDISLTGGTSITIFKNINTAELKTTLASKLNGISTKQVYDLMTGEKKAVIIETKSSAEQAKNILQKYLGYNLTEENSSFEFTGSTLSENFYRQLLVAILIAFIFMAIVVFLIFRTFVPSTAVILSAFADILMTLALVNLFGMKMSSAGIVAFLMLIGYSVDTDILLTTRVLKRKEGSLNHRIYGAFKTGVTMSLTSLFAILVALFVVKSFSIVLTQIFAILVIGLGFDILNTWITNVSLLKWYVEMKR